MQARLVSTMRSPSACSSMSSQTHPQKVQVAFFTTVSSIAAPLYRLIWPSEPDGRMNVQPSSRPWQLPRMRRGM